MAVVEALIIENISNQIVKILHEKAPNRGFAVSETLGSQKQGLLPLAPGKKVTVQQDRINLGQIAGFEEKGLIKSTRTRI